MSLQKRIKLRTKRRRYRVRNKFASRGVKMRISVFRSLNHDYVQIIDDVEHKTVLSLSSLSLTKASGSKREKARQVGVELAKKAVNQGIKEVFFDRGQFLFHGRVREVAEGLREGGLQF